MDAFTAPLSMCLFFHYFALAASEASDAVYDGSVNRCNET